MGHVSTALTTLIVLLGGSRIGGPFSARRQRHFASASRVRQVAAAAAGKNAASGARVLDFSSDSRALARERRRQDDDSVYVYGSVDCPCVGIDSLQGETTVVINGTTKASYPAELGGRCDAWDDGRHPTSCLAGGSPGKGEGWCAQEWCFVDPCNCNLPELPEKSSYLLGAEYQGKPIYFSYATCGSKDSYSQQSEEATRSRAKEIGSTCNNELEPSTWGSETCRCIGIASRAPPGATNFSVAGHMLAYPADAGASCSSWDSDIHPDCKESVHKPQWCEKAWCYVDPCSCKLESPPEASAYLSNVNFQGRPMYYSYATCGAHDSYTSTVTHACVNQATSENCKKLEHCSWARDTCLGKELVDACNSSDKVEMRIKTRHAAVKSNFWPIKPARLLAVPILFLLVGR